jgi:hypothetical protein
MPENFPPGRFVSVKLFSPCRNLYGKRYKKVSNRVRFINNGCLKQIASRTVSNCHSKKEASFFFPFLNKNVLCRAGLSKHFSP